MNCHKRLLVSTDLTFEFIQRYEDHSIDKFISSCYVFESCCCVLL